MLPEDGVEVAVSLGWEMQDGFLKTPLVLSG